MLNKLLLCLFLLLPSFVFAQAVPDTNSDAFSAGSADSVTITYTVGAGSNSLALCGVSTSQPITSFTFNSVTLDPVYTANPYGGISFSLWKIVGVSGTHDFFVSTSPNATYTGVGCATFHGVDQTTPLGSYATAQNPDFITLTVPVNGLAMDFGGHIPDSCSAFTPTAGQTALFNDCAEMANNISVRASYRSTTGDFTWDPPDYPFAYYTQIGVPINPVATPGTAVRHRPIIQ